MQNQQSRMKNYKFYMQLTTKAGVTTGSVKDLETDFPGLHYSKIEGLEAVGAPKNIYTENYAEADGLRVYHPADNNGAIAHEATEVKLTLVFFDDKRRKAYNDFCRFLEGGRMFYWDNARNKKVWLIFDKEVEPDADTITPDGYISAAFAFTNIWGIGKECNDNGVLL